MEIITLNLCINVDIMNELTDFSLDQKADLLQNMSIEQLNELFRKGTPITLNWDFTEEWDKTDLAAKMEQTGLSEAIIRTIETDKTQAVLKDIIRYCKGLNVPLIDFLQEELVLEVWE